MEVENTSMIPCMQNESHAGPKELIMYNLNKSGACTIASSPLPSDFRLLSHALTDHSQFPDSIILGKDLNLLQVTAQAIPPLLMWHLL